MSRSACPDWAFRPRLPKLPELQLTQEWPNSKSPEPGCRGQFSWSLLVELRELAVFAQNRERRELQYESLPNKTNELAKSFGIFPNLAISWTANSALADRDPAFTL